MPRSFRHWTPRYLKNRVIQLSYEKTHPNNPWLTRQSVNILSDLLQDTDRGIEFGSGRSTLWFSNRIEHLISIEHNLEWYNYIKRRIIDLDLEHKVDYRYCETMSDYVSQIDTVEDCSIDFCLIDGKERDTCAMKALAKLKPEGILIIDNVNLYLPNDSKSPNSIREFDSNNPSSWQLVLEQIDSWEKIWTTNGVSDTGVWIKT